MKGWQFFLGRHCLPASLKHVNCWNLHEKYDSSSLTKVGSETRLVKLIFFLTEAGRFGLEILSFSPLVIICH